MSFVENRNPQQASILRSVLLTLVLLMLFCVGWHYLALMPIFAGMAAMMTGGVWAILIGSVVAYCVIMLLAFVLSGIGLMLITIFGLIIALLALVLAPFAFPILVPLAIVLAFIVIHRRRQHKLTKQKNGQFNQLP